jgi:hypothetical protein
MLSLILLISGFAILLGQAVYFYLTADMRVFSGATRRSVIPDAGRASPSGGAPDPIDRPLR